MLIFFQLILSVNFISGCHCSMVKCVVPYCRPGYAPTKHEKEIIEAVGSASVCSCVFCFPGGGRTEIRDKWIMTLKDKDTTWSPSKRCGVCECERRHRGAGRDWLHLMPAWRVERKKWKGHQTLGQLSAIIDARKHRQMWALPWHCVNRARLEPTEANLKEQEIQAARQVKSKVVATGASVPWVTLKWPLKPSSDLLNSETKN